MKKNSSKELEKEDWISFEKYEEEVFLSEKEVDELALDTYKWVLKLNVSKLKNNKKFMSRVHEAKERNNK